MLDRKIRGGVPVLRRPIVMPRLRKQSVSPTAASSPFRPPDELLYLYEWYHLRMFRLQPQRF